MNIEKPASRSVATQSEGTHFATSHSWRWVSHTDPLWVWRFPGEELDELDELDEELEVLNWGGSVVVDEYVLPLFKIEIRAAIRRVSRRLPRAKLLWLAHHLREAADDVVAELVAESRSRGISWTRIGHSLGVGRTAAQKRFGQGPSPRQQRALEYELQRLIEYCHAVQDDEEATEKARDAARDTLERLRQRLDGDEGPDAE